MSNDELNIIKSFFDCLDDRVRDNITVCLAALEQNDRNLFQRSQAQLVQTQMMLRQIKLHLMPAYSQQIKKEVLH